MSSPAPDDLCTAPGIADLTFGSLLVEMLRGMFSRCETLDPNAPHRFYVECKQCQGTDNDRPRGQRRSMELVKHADGCLLAKHLPRIKAMANKGVT
jgi:hypothetical protein